MKEKELTKTSWWFQIVKPFGLHGLYTNYFSVVRANQVNYLSHTWGDVMFLASDRQGSNFKSYYWRTVPSDIFHNPKEVLLAQFSLYVHKTGLNTMHSLADRVRGNNP